MPEKAAKDLVADWLGGEYTMFEAATEDPETAWKAILKLSRRSLTNEQRSLLAGGPLETLLVWHGSDFIGRVEQEAKFNAHFSHLLGGVWCGRMSHEIRNRIEGARKETW